MNKKFIVPILLIALLSLISYFNVFQNEFVWDDHIFILDNPDIRSLSNLPLFFSQDTDGLYRPLRSVYYALVYSFAGKNEFWYHFNSLFLHTAVSILVFFVVYNIFNKKNIALVSSLIFAAHPIHTERVTNITAGFDLLGVFLLLLSFFFYIKFSKSGAGGHLISSLLLLLLAVFSSEEAITLPLLIILYEFCFNREKFSNKHAIIKNIADNYLPYFIVAIFYLAIRFLVVGLKGRIEEYLAGNFFLTALTMLKAYVYYIYLLIAPINLTLFHDVKAATAIFDFGVLLSFLALAAVMFFTLKYNKNKAVFFPVFWFFITLIPFSNLLPLQVFMAERYLYVPSIAFSLLVSYAFVSIFNYNFENNKKIIRNGTAIFIVALLAFYVFSTINRNNDWKDDMVLWSKTVLTNPNNSRAHDNLGFTYERMGETEKALHEFGLAVKLQEDDFKALANLAVAYAKLGRYNESLIALKKSIEIREYHKTYDKLGLVYDEIGMEEDAIKSFKEAISLNPRYAKAHNDLGAVYGKTGKFDLALEEFNKAIRIDRDYADAHFNKGILLEFLGEKDKANQEFKTAAKLEPKTEMYMQKLK